MKTKKIAFLLLSAILLITSTGCSNKTSLNSSGTAKLQVYTSFYAMYDFAKLIGGEHIDAYSMCPTGTEPHEYEPKTSDMAKLSEADVFIYNGMGMESWAEKTISSLKSDTIESVVASDGIKYISENDDPHVWLDPRNALVEMENIKTAFCNKDSKNSDYYEKQYNECKSEIDKLINDYKNVTSKFADRNIVVSHAAFGYLCSAFNLNQTAIEGLQGESDPSPAHMAEIIDFIQTNQIKYIFSEELESSKTIESVAKETGTQVLTLNPFEGDKDGKDYFTVMEENLEILKKALN